MSSHSVPKEVNDTYCCASKKQFRMQGPLKDVSVVSGNSGLPDALIPGNTDPCITILTIPSFSYLHCLHCSACCYARSPVLFPGEGFPAAPAPVAAAAAAACEQSSSSARRSMDAPGQGATKGGREDRSPFLNCGERDCSLPNWMPLIQGRSMPCLHGEGARLALHLMLWHHDALGHDVTRGLSLLQQQRGTPVHFPRWEANADA